MRILGIDPGSRRTGYGVIEAEGPRLRHVAHGVINAAASPWPERLGVIYRELEALVAEHDPQAAAVERVFLARNPDSALKLGQARGAALAALVRGGLAVHEYSAREVKQAIVGTGGAAKGQIQHMTRVLLGLAEQAPEDAADALAVALCHAQLGAMRERLAAAEARQQALQGRSR